MYAFAARIAVDLKLFHLIAASTSTISAGDLADATGSDEELIGKICPADCWLINNKSVVFRTNHACHFRSWICSGSW
jgi:hypothetical protein